MKYIFLAIIAGLIALSFVAWAISPKPVQDGKTILYWTIDNNPTRQGQVALFNEMHPQYDLRIVTWDPKDRLKVIVQCLAGVGPDIFCAFSTFELAAYIKSGIAWDITDELKAMGVDIHNDVWNGANPCLMYNGRLYGFPNNVAVDAIWYNKDIFDACGIDYPKGPWTWEEFIKLAQKLTIKDENGRIKHFGFVFGWESVQWYMFVRQWGGRVFSEDGTRCELDCSETIAAIQFMQDLIYKYKIAPSPEQEAGMASVGGWELGPAMFFNSGNAAMALGGRWWLIAMRNYKDLNEGVVECPHGPYRVYHSYGKATLINSRSPRRREALDFLKYMMTPEYNDLINKQGDAMPPMKKYCFTEGFLYNSEHPEEDYNAIWRDVMQYGIPERPSPFVDGAIAKRIIKDQLDLVKINQKSAADAMRSAADEINKEIQKSIKQDPVLRAKYEALISKRGLQNEV